MERKCSKSDAIAGLNGRLAARESRNIEMPTKLDDLRTKLVEVVEDCNSCPLVDNNQTLLPYHYCVGLADKLGMVSEDGTLVDSGSTGATIT